MSRMKLGRQKRKGVLILILLGVILFMIVRKAYAAKNYPVTNYPFYSANFAPENPQPRDELTIVSYNIRYAEQIDQAIIELKNLKSLQGLDIVLLQEMDEVGVEEIAQALNYNFVYFPAAIEPRYGKNFGNAILSRWPITDSAKLILPHKSLSSRMNRIATRATIKINDSEILVYSVHAETIFTLPKFREDQFKAILEDMDEDAELVIIGGDFNSISKADVKGIVDIYKPEGFIRATESSGYTVKKYRVKAIADHIFSRGFNIQEDGKIENAMASDHLPIWVKLVIK